MNIGISATEYKSRLELGILCSACFAKAQSTLVNVDVNVNVDGNGNGNGNGWSCPNRDDHLKVSIYLTTYEGANPIYASDFPFQDPV